MTDMKTYEIWSSGHSANSGEHSGPTFHGKIDASSFKEACDEIAAMSFQFDKYYDRNRMTYWGCSLHETREEALKGTPKRKKRKITRDYGPAQP